MTDMQTKQVIKYLASISKNLSTIAAGINHLVKETRDQNKLTMEMLQAAESLEDTAEAEYYDEDFAEVTDGEIVHEEGGEEEDDE